MTENIAPVLGETTVKELGQAVRGEVFTPADAGYEQAARSGTACTTGDDSRPDGHVVPGGEEATRGASTPT